MPRCANTTNVFDTNGKICKLWWGQKVDHYMPYWSYIINYSFQSSVVQLKNDNWKQVFIQKIPFWLDFKLNKWDTEHKVCCRFAPCTNSIWLPRSEKRKRHVGLNDHRQYLVRPVPWALYIQQKNLGLCFRNFRWSNGGNGSKTFEITF